MDDPRSLALTDWDALDPLACALVTRSAGRYGGRGDLVRYEACTTTRIGEASGVRVRDINRDEWTWNVCRQTTRTRRPHRQSHQRQARPHHADHRRVRPMVARRYDRLRHDPGARLFTGPLGRRITTAVLRDATQGSEATGPTGRGRS